MYNYPNHQTASAAQKCVGPTLLFVGIFRGGRTEQNEQMATYPYDVDNAARLSVTVE